MSTNSTIHGEMGNSPWKGRGDLGQMVAELQRQKDSKVDFVADTRSLKVVPVFGEKVNVGGSLRLAGADPATREFLPSDGINILPSALPQIGERVSPNIPTIFLRKLADERAGRAADLLNGLLADEPAKRLIRCLDGNVRAFLSNSYRVLDNYDLAFAALEAVQAKGGEVIECSLSDTHMRIKFTSRSVFDAINEVRNGGDKGNWFAGGLGNQSYLGKVSAKTTGELPGGPGTVHPLVTITNSETGHGGLAVRVGILKAICFNLATVEDVAVRVHLGERMEAGILKQDTISAESKAIMLKCRDSIHAAFEPDVFKRLVQKCHEAQSQAVTAPQSAVANVVKVCGLSEAAKDGILAHFLRDYDPTRYGLAQAVARYAQDVPDGDDAAGIEDAAGRIIREKSLVTAA